MTSTSADEVHVIGHVVHAGKGVELIAEELAVFFEAQYVAVGVDALFVHHVDVDQVIADLVRGVREHQHDFLCAFGNSAQTDGKAVAAENGEDDADRLSAKLLANVERDVVDRCVVSLRSGNDGFGHRDDVAVTNFKALLLRGLQDTVNDDFTQIVALADDRGANASGYGSHHAAHEQHLLFFYHKIIQHAFPFVKHFFHRSASLSAFFFAA